MSTFTQNTCLKTARCSYRMIAFAMLFVTLSGCAYTLQTIGRVIWPNSSAQVGEDVRIAGSGPSVAEVEEVAEMAKAAEPSKNTTSKLEAAPKNIMTSEKLAVATKVAPVKQKQKAKVRAASAKPATPTRSKLASIGVGSLIGKVDILGKNNALLSADGLILRLRQVGGKSIREDSRTKTHYVDMKQKKYAPGYVSINAGDTLTFVNNDTIKHNVFSSTGNNAFDLGTYDGGLERDVTLHEAGLVKIYCNIHRNMAMFVSVDDQGRSTPADENGHFAFDDVPVGDYDLEIWHLRGKKTIKISVKENEETRLAEVLDTASFIHAPHKNKFGNGYKTKKSLYGRKKEQKLMDDENF